MKRIYTTLFIVIGLLSYSLSAFANSDFEVASSDIKIEIETEYLNHYANALDTQKKEFHANDQDSFQKAQLGEGLAYYNINVQNKSNPSLKLAGYVFPLLLNGEQVGTIHTENFEGKWTIFNVSSLTDLDKDIQLATSNQNGAGTVKFIDDKSYGVKSVYIQDTNGDRIIDLKSGKVSTVSEFNQEMIKMDTEKQNTTNSGLFLKAGGTGTAIVTNSLPNHRTIYIFFALGILFLLPVISFIIKFKRRIS